MYTRGRKKAEAEPTPPARDPHDVETIERLQQRIQELEGLEEESCLVYDTDNEEEESMPVYDTDIEDVIEEEEGCVGKGGFGGEEDNIEDIVVVANDMCSSMIQTILSFDFEEDINTKSHELMFFGKKYYYQDDQGLRSSPYKEREFDAGDTNLDATNTRDE
ncbi:hypothetical protein Tco_1282018 [Tanacetum coccineum]